MSGKDKKYFIPLQAPENHKNNYNTVNFFLKSFKVVFDS